MENFPARAPRLIASDIDGTLLDRNHRVPRRNRDAVARAVQQCLFCAFHRPSVPLDSARVGAASRAAGVRDLEWRRAL